MKKSSDNRSNNPGNPSQCRSEDGRFEKCSGSQSKSSKSSSSSNSRKSSDGRSSSK